MCDFCDIIGDIACDDACSGLFDLILDCASGIIDVIGSCTDASKNRRDPPGGAS
jgi:hypothetical protein